MSPEIGPEAICIPSEDVVAREIEGELVIVPLAAGVGDVDGELYTLNETARSIWSKLDGKRTLGDVAELLALEFDVSLSELRGDVLGFAAEMVRRRILSAKV